MGSESLVKMSLWINICVNIHLKEEKEDEEANSRNNEEFEDILCSGFGNYSKQVN